MKVYSYSQITAFIRKYPDAKSSLERWHKLMTKSNCSNVNQLKLTFPKLSSVKDNKGNSLVVFDINGGRFRLTTSIDYISGEVLIRYVQTHAEYDKNNWKKG